MNRMRRSVQMMRFIGIVALALWTGICDGYQKPVRNESDSQPRLVVQLGHSRYVTSVAFSPDGGS